METETVALGARERRRSRKTDENKKNRWWDGMNGDEEHERCKRSKRKRWIVEETM